MSLATKLALVRRLGVIVILSAPGTFFFLTIGIDVGEFCTQYGGIMKCYELSREFAEFIRQYKLLIGLAAVDVTLPSLYMVKYTLKRVFVPYSVDLVEDID